MNVDLADWRAFVEVADRGTFHAAARAIHLSQPALSRRISKLEEVLGVRLFERTTRKVELTSAGRSFLHRARHVLSEVEAALIGTRDVAEKLAGEVTVACVSSAVRYFIPNVLKPYHERFPNIRVRVIDEGQSEILPMVARGEAHFGLTYTGAQEPDIDFRPIFKERFVVACLRDHALARQRSATWAQISKYDYITLGRGSGNRMLIDLALANAAVQPRWFIEVRHVSALVSLVEAGLGIGVVPRLAMPRDADAALASVPVVQPSVTRTLGLIQRRGRPLSGAAQLLYELFADFRFPRSRG